MKSAAWMTLTFLGLAATGGVLVWGIYCFWTSDPAWTTRSKAALEEFEQGLEDYERIYLAEAEAHFTRALELDPRFTMARIYRELLRLEPGQGSQRLAAELHACELEGLQAREQFLVRYLLADLDGRRNDAAALLDDFLAAYPTDLFGLERRCDGLWAERNWPAVEACYADLLELHPNWVTAHERLGFVAMSQGHFGKAEEHFSTYRYLAPDEARPHTSLAQLLILLGRYEEAERSLDQALSLHEGDCPALQHLARLRYFTGEQTAAEHTLDQIASNPSCGPWVDGGWVCRSRAFIAFQRREIEAAWSQLEGDCLERLGGWDVVAHRIALAAGRADADAAMVEVLDRRIAAAEQGRPYEAEHYRAARAHAAGLRLLGRGDAAAAAAMLESADRLLRYWDPGQGSFKLLNRLSLAAALRQAGEEARAEATIRKVAAVNPRLEGGLVMPDLEIDR